MATREQIETILVLVHDTHPATFFKRIDDTSAGISAVLRFLYEADGEVTSGQISSSMNVSTARMAVLLKKMDAKGLICKETGAADARTTVVRLSGFGRETVEKIHADMYRQVGCVIDKIGMERLIEFTTVAREICSIMKGPHIEFIDKE